MYRFLAGIPVIYVIAALLIPGVFLDFTQTVWTDPFIQICLGMAFLFWAAVYATYRILVGSLADALFQVDAAH